MKFKHITLLVILLLSLNSPSQNSVPRDGVVKYLSADSTLYIKGTGLAQIWLRYNFNNPGSTIFGTPQKETFDVGLRRARYQIMGQISAKTFLYMQIGINSFNDVTTRKTPIFFHDVTAEYAVFKNYFTVGAGLHGYNGTSRYSSSGVSSILCLDLPTIQETTNDVTDQFVRKLGVYAKGKIGRLDYKFSLSNPFPVQTSLSTVAPLDSSKRNIAFYNTEAPKLQTNGYMMWQFFDKESNQLPYMTGSYLGKKKVFNIGAGFSYQPDAMWYRQTGSGDTARVPLQQFAADVFYDAPVNKEKRNAVTLYGAYLIYNFGPNYIRNAGPMNMTNGVAGTSSFNGTGNNAPLIGTGNVIYFQGAYLFRKDLLKSQGTLQPYVNLSYASYERLKSPMYIYGIGINWIQLGNNSKISLEYQDRPIFNADAGNNLKETTRRGSIIMQYQVAF